VKGERFLGVLAKRRVPRTRSDHFNGRVARVRKQHVMLDDLDRVESRRDPSVARPLREQAIARRSRDMGFSRKEPVIGFETSRGWKARDPLLDLVLRRDMCGREAIDRRLPFRISRAGDEQQASAGGRAGNRRPNARGQPRSHGADATPGVRRRNN
jgi:hypothetical protein